MISPSTNFRILTMEFYWPLKMTLGGPMPRKLPPNVEKNVVKGKAYFSYRIGKGPRTRLYGDPNSQEFMETYVACLTGATIRARPMPTEDPPLSIGALIASYKQSSAYKALRETSKAGYTSRLETMRVAHGGRAVAGLTRERIETHILAPLANRPGAQLDTLKKLRILINHAIALKWLKHDPSQGIKRAKSREIRAWLLDEKAAYEARWPIGSKQRTAYALMKNVGTARVDVHRMTWQQLEGGLASYKRSKTGVEIEMAQSIELQTALAAWPKQHVTIINTEYGRPFTVDGFSNFMRKAMDAAGLPRDCKPHGLRKSLGEELADAEATSHDIRAALGHITTAESDKYTREADRRRGGKRAVALLDAHRQNINPQIASKSLGKIGKTEGKSK